MHVNNSNPSSSMEPHERQYLESLGLNPQPDSVSAIMAHNDPDSPQASTEVSSIQLNKEKNTKALERGLKARRPVNELIGQGIMISQPGVCNAEKVRKLERAKTTDLLKHKIEKRPERQQLVDQHILKSQSSQLSPLLAEKCEIFEKDRLKETLSAKLANRPGSLELVERRVIPVDEKVLEMIQDGWISYPRVSKTAADYVSNTIYEENVEFTGGYDPPEEFHPFSINSDDGWANLEDDWANLKVKRIERMTNSKPNLPKTPIPETAGTRQYHGKSTTGKIQKTRRDHINKLGQFVFHKYDPEQYARELQQEKFLSLQNEESIQQEKLLIQQNQETIRQLPLFNDLHDKFILQIQQQLHVPGSPSAVKLESTVPTAPPPPPPPKVKKRPPNGVVNMLECLTVSQLKTECRNRSLPCSGVKNTLLKHLEPHKVEILAKFNSQSRHSFAAASPQPADSPKFCSLSLDSQSSNEMKHSSSAPQIDYSNNAIPPFSTILNQQPVVTTNTTAGAAPCEPIVWQTNQSGQMYATSPDAIIQIRIRSLDQKTKEIRQSIINNLMKQKQSGLSEYSERCQLLANERQCLSQELSQTRAFLHQLASERLEDLKNQLIRNVETTSSNQQSPSNSCRQSWSSSGIDPESEARLEEIEWLEELLKKSTSAEQVTIAGGVGGVNGLFTTDASRNRSSTADSRLNHSASYTNLPTISSHSLPMTPEPLITQYSTFHNHSDFFHTNLSAEPHQPNQHDVLSDLSEIIQNDPTNNQYNSNDDVIDDSFIDELCNGTDPIYNYDSSAFVQMTAPPTCLNPGQLTDHNSSFFTNNSSTDCSLNPNSTNHAYFSNQFGVASPMQVDNEVEMSSGHDAPPPPAFIPSSICLSTQQTQNVNFVNGLQSKMSNSYNSMNYFDYNQMTPSKLSFNGEMGHSSNNDCQLYSNWGNQPNSMDVSDSADLFLQDIPTTITR